MRYRQTPPIDRTLFSHLSNITRSRNADGAGRVLLSLIPQRTKRRGQSPKTEGDKSKEKIYALSITHKSINSTKKLRNLTKIFGVVCSCQYNLTHKR